MPGPLEGIRVFDLTLVMVGTWSTMNLGALGADVIHIERSGIEESSLGGGVPPSINGMSVGYISWNLNKRQMFLDLKSEGDIESARKLITTCDVFVENMRTGVADRLGMSYEALSKINPRLVYCSISGWGETGPMAETSGSDHRVQPFSGFSSNSGVPGGRGEFYRHFTQVDATTGNYATQAMIMGLVARERTGRGQRVDLSMLEVSLALQSTRVGEFLTTGRQPPLLGSAHAAIAPSEAFHTEDGIYLGIEVRTAKQWAGLCRAVGLDALLEDERLATNSGRVAHREELGEKIARAIASKPYRWWHLRLAKEMVPHARQLRFEELKYHPQVIENRYMDTIDTEAWGKVYVGGLPWTFSRTPADITPTALVGEHTGLLLDEIESLPPLTEVETPASKAPGPPLAGYRVLELAQAISGPYAALELADAGADVIKVEHLTGDVARGWEPRTATGDSAAFVQLNRNKRSVRLDLESSAGKEALRALIAGADVLIEDVDLTRELGIDVAALGADRDRLVHLRLSGFGPKGPWADLPATEIGAQLASEATSALGHYGQAPVRMGTDAGSMYAGIYGVQGVLAALWRRERDGKGQRLDVSPFGAMVAMRSTLWAAQSNPDNWGGFHLDSYFKPPYHGYKTKDGYLHFTVGRQPEDKWRQLAEDLGLDWERDKDDLAKMRTGNPSGSRLAYAAIPLWERVFATKTTDELIALFDRYGAEAFPVQDYATVTAHPQTQHLGIVKEVQAGNDTLRVVRSPWRFRDTPVVDVAPPPALGEHTAAVLAEMGVTA